MNFTVSFNILIFISRRCLTPRRVDDKAFTGIKIRIRNPNRISHNPIQKVEKYAFSTVPGLMKLNFLLITVDSSKIKLRFRTS